MRLGVKINEKMVVICLIHKRSHEIASSTLVNRFALVRKKSECVSMSYFLFSMNNRS